MKISMRKWLGEPTHSKVHIEAIPKTLLYFNMDESPTWLMGASVDRVFRAIIRSRVTTGVDADGGKQFKRHLLA